MQSGFRLDIRTLTLLTGAALALYVLNDLRSLSANSCPTTVGSPLVQDRVVTKELVITDDQGTTRVRLGNSNLNAPALSLHDGRGNERGLLRLNQNEVPSLRLFDANGTLRSGVGFAQNDLSPHLWFFDEAGAGTELMPPMMPTNLSADISQMQRSIQTVEEVDPCNTIIYYKDGSVQYNATMNINETTVSGRPFQVQKADVSTDTDK